MWPSKYAQIRLTPLGEPPNRLKSGHPPHTLPYSAVGTDPPSALAMRPPEFQPDLRLCRKYTSLQ